MMADELRPPLEPKRFKTKGVVDINQKPMAGFIPFSLMKELYFVLGRLKAEVTIITTILSCIALLLFVFSYIPQVLPWLGQR